MQCQRPVCFFAHTMQQLRLGTLPKSLDSPDGGHFAAYYGGPAYGRMRGTSHLQASTGEVCLSQLLWCLLTCESKTSLCVSVSNLVFSLLKQQGMQFLLQTVMCMHQFGLCLRVPCLCAAVLA